MKIPKRRGPKRLYFVTLVNQKGEKTIVRIHANGRKRARWVARNSYERDPDWMETEDVWRFRGLRLYRDDAKGRNTCPPGGAH